ncbi:aldehyde dehydrogenase 12A1 [Actinidia rufa]|uniref:Aldehyde dehydrogenase 12A1 n=1 Tax=Actinidia rufa TaxID=165716 RepID=A0A7J0FY74_9ERIC|nr:aldehyde dehydrogenase 12A1 [Actinidia rufa]
MVLSSSSVRVEEEESGDGPVESVTSSSLTVVVTLVSGLEEEDGDEEEKPVYAHNQEEEPSVGMKSSCISETGSGSLQVGIDTRECRSSSSSPSSSVSEKWGGCASPVRFLARSFAIPGNHLGQQSHGFRWPYGPVAIITPFNFPLEIPVLQLMGALYMGNKPVLKVDSKVCIVMEQMLRLLHDCGLPVEDVDFINSDGKTMNKLLLEGNPRMTLFTGSSRVADKLAVDLKGRIKLEDAGFDWKILGPDVEQVDYVAWVCDQDAYACSGQKCSAQSMLFMHENWSKSSLFRQMNDLAARRKLEDLTVGPVLTFTTEAMLEHMNKLLRISGSKLLFGGEALKNHSIPSIYGAIKPTAIFVPLEEILKDNNYELVTREIFGPFQVTKGN